MENIFIKCDRDIKVGQTADRLESRTINQNPLNNHLKWAKECKVLLNIDNSSQDESTVKRQSGKQLAL